MDSSKGHVKRDPGTSTTRREDAAGGRADFLLRTQRDEAERPRARAAIRMKAWAACVVMTLSTPGMAGEKTQKESTVDIDDLFGAPPAKPMGLDAMREATDGVSAQGSASNLAPREAPIDHDAPVKFTAVFAAPRIEHDRKNGCQPAGPDKMRITTWTFDEVPARASRGFDVCLRIESTAGREMNMSLGIVDARNQRVARAEDVINFQGRTKVDHVLEYPAPFFHLAGRYFYVVDLDGKEVARLPLFTVQVSGRVDASDVAEVGTASTSAGSTQKTTP